MLRWYDRVDRVLPVASACVLCESSKRDVLAVPAPRKRDVPPQVDLRMARSGNRMLLMNFTGSDWCPPCIRLDRQVFSQPEFAEYAAKDLVLLEIDFPHNKAQTAEQKAANDKLADRYGIYGYPTEIVLDANGKKIGELGYMPGGPKAFIAAIEKLRQAAGTGAAER